MQAFLGLAIFVGAWVSVARHFKGKGAGGFRRHLAGFGVGFLSVCVFAIVVGEKASTSGSKVQESTAVANTTPPEEKPIAISAGKLFAAYDANEVAADQQFKGKRLAVSGTVQEVAKDAFNNIVIELKSSNEFMPVRAYLEKGFENHAASLSKGQSISFVCSGEGKIVGSPVLRECQPV